jgi:predicted nucleic acid-binding protein
MPQAIADTGPIVASLNPRDPYHEWAVRALRTIDQPLLTCESAVAEMCYIIGARLASKVIGLLGNDVLEIGFSLEAEKSSVHQLMKKYSDQPMSLADACLVRMSELHPDHRVFTLDSDFRVYRRFGRRVVPLLIP